MSRSYIQLECGCLVSCDGGGGLIPVCGSFNEKTGFLEESKDCKVQEYMKEHHSDFYYCPICHPTEYKEEVMGYMKNIHTLIITKFPDKKEEIIKDFNEWKEGIRALPRTTELREILDIINEKT